MRVLAHEFFMKQSCSSLGKFSSLTLGADPESFELGLLLHGSFAAFRALLPAWWFHGFVDVLG